MNMSTRQKSNQTTPYRQLDATQTLTVVRPRERLRRKMNGAIIFTIAAALVAAVGLLYLLQTNHVANLGYEMSALQREQAQLVTENQRLTAELSSYQSIGDIELRATGELSMSPATEMRFLEAQQPAELELPDPASGEPPSKSFFGRLVDRITGRGEAGGGQEPAP